MTGVGNLNPISDLAPTFSQEEIMDESKEIIVQSSELVRSAIDVKTPGSTDPTSHANGYERKRTLWNNSRL